MSNAIRLSELAVLELSNAILACSDVVEEENRKIRKDFDTLGATFKDQFYREYETEIEKGEQVLSQSAQSIKENAIALLKYADDVLQPQKIPNS